MTQQPAIHPTDGPIHDYFELTYADHLVKNRTLLQSMPIEWQEPFVDLLRQLDDAFDHIDKPAGYKVVTGKWMQLDDMTLSDLHAAGIEMDGEEPDAGPGRDTVYHREFDGAELAGSDYGFVPRRDPIPHYRHEYIEPRLPKPAEESGWCTFGEGDAPGSGCILPAGHEPANRHVVTPGDTDDD
jgi:hypothetical protein